MRILRVLTVCCIVVALLAAAGIATAAKKSVPPKPATPAVSQPTSPHPGHGIPASPKPEVLETPTSRRPAPPEHGSPVGPKPKDGSPSQPKPVGGNPRGERPTAGDPTSPHPTVSQPTTTPPAGGPTSPRPTGGDPKSPKPATGVPDSPKPSQARPTEKPVGGMPSGKVPGTSQPSAKPADSIKIQGALQTISQQELERLVQAGHSLTEVIRADKAAADGIAPVAQLLKWRTEGRSWKEILQQAQATPITGAEVRLLLQEPKNTQVQALVNSIAQLAHISADDLLRLMGDQLTLSDMRNAAGIANATGKALDQVLSLKTPANTWEDVAKSLRANP